MPVTILCKAIGMTPESILANFFDFDNFELKSEGAMMEFVPERWKGEMARFDIADRSGKVIVEKDKRINAKHLRDGCRRHPAHLRAGRLPVRPRAGQEHR